MTKIILLSISLALLLPGNINSQDMSNIPEQVQGVSEKTYSRAVRILKETYKSIENDDGTYTYADYWNIAIAYADMKQPPQVITDLLFKSQQLNPENFSEVCASFPETVDSWQAFMATEDFNKIKALAVMPAAAPKRNNDKLFGATTANEDSALQTLLRKVKKADQNVRALAGVENVKLQKRVDKKNLAVIDSLYMQYGQYIGQDMVGKELAYVMWLIVQHSSLDDMKRYLPVIHGATVAQQLPSDKPLKLLLDRIYAIEYKYQFFGTQAGVDLAPPAAVNRIKKEYCLD